jgi:hypothetical protein
MSQLFSGENVKIGNVTLGVRPGVMAMPLMCMTFSGNLCALPTSMAKNMNQSSMMMGPSLQGNQSMSDMAAMMMHSGMIPSVCFPMSDAMLIKSMMMYGGSMNSLMGGGNMTSGSATMGGGK